MDYKKLYYSLCEYCKAVPVKDRILQRNKNDFRLGLSDDIIYTEKHHIIPRHCGGNNEIDNLVILLPEEHYIAHLLRWKAYNSRNDFLAVRLIVNGLISKKSIKEKFPNDIEYNKFKNRLIKWKQHIYEFKKDNSWHSENGIKSISAARKNTMVVRDSLSGEIIGSVNVNHANIKSGKWVHHSKGKMSITNKVTGERLYINTESYDSNIHAFNSKRQDGKHNGNYKQINYDFIDEIYKIIPKHIENDYLHKSNFIKEISEISKKYYKNPISIVWVNNHLGSINKMLDDYNKKFNTAYKYYPYYRGFSSYKQTRS